METLVVGRGTQVGGRGVHLRRCLPSFPFQAEEGAPRPQPQWGGGGAYIGVGRGLHESPRAPHGPRWKIRIQLGVYGSSGDYF